MSTVGRRQPLFQWGFGGGIPIQRRAFSCLKQYLQREIGRYTAHHLPLPKTSGNIQHDVKSRAKPLQIQGFIVRGRPEILIDSHPLKGPFLGSGALAASG